MADVIKAFKRRSVVHTFSVAANARHVAAVKTIIDNDLPEGATFIGIVGWVTGNYNISVLSLAYSASGYSLSIRNNSDEAIDDATITIYYLYI